MNVIEKFATVSYLRPDGKRYWQQVPKYVGEQLIVAIPVDATDVKYDFNGLDSKSLPNPN